MLEILETIRNGIAYFQKEIHYFERGMSYGLGPFDIERLRIAVWSLKKAERIVLDCLPK